MQMLSTEKLAELSIGTNLALSLPKTHDFGNHFVKDYVDDPVALQVDPEWKEGFTHRTTDYDSMRQWCDALGVLYAEPFTWNRAFEREAPKRFNFTEKHHSILIGILGIIQVLLDVHLLNEID